MPDDSPSQQTLLRLFEEAFGPHPSGLCVLSGEASVAQASPVYANGVFLAACGGTLEGFSKHFDGPAGCLRLPAGDVAFRSVPLRGRDGRRRFHLLSLEDTVVKQAPAGPRQEGGSDFAALLEHAGAGIIAHRHFRPLYANSAAARLLGCDSPAALLREASLLRFVPLESYSVLLTRQRRLLENRQAGEARLLRCITAGGTPSWVEAADSLMNWQGTPIACLTLIEAGDLAAARQSETLLREAVDNLSDSFILYDEDDRVVLTNRRWHEVFPTLPGQQEIRGAAMEDLVRRNVENGDVTDPTLREDNVEAWIASFLAGRRSRKLFLSEDAWPSGKWDLVREQRLDSGGFISVRTDITDRKRAEEALRDQEVKLERALAERTRHLEAVLSNIAQGVVVLDPELRVVLTNDGLHEIVGYPRALGRPGTHVSELIRDRLGHELYLPGENTNLDAEVLLQRRLEAYRTLTREVYQHPFPNGRTIEIHREKLRDGSIICTFTDVTDKLRAEEELTRQREALHQSEKLSALGMLLAGVAHELNNPLQVVLGQAALLENALQDEGEIERARRIRAAAERCAKIVKVFLAMARDEPASRVEIDVNEALERALDLVSYQLGRAGVEVRCELAAALPRIAGDPDQLNQVFVNLLINAMQALEAAPSPRRITLRTLALSANGEVEILVADSGPGVPEALRSRIFDPFFTTKPIGVGTGVGLSVCHGMVTAHGGSISVEDAPEEGGARFRVRLPCAGAAAPGFAEVSQAGAAAPGTQGRVLIVDDEQEIRELLSEFLKPAGLEIVAVSSGGEALRLLESERFAAVVCDLRLPGMDGPELFAAACGLSAELGTRFVFATGDLLSESSQRFLAEAARPYLEKPFLPDQVRRIVLQTVEQAKSPA
ncbi:MAG: PAS-domain containing protein [Rhodovibrionaceae bacterium]